MNKWTWYFDNSSLTIDFNDPRGMIFLVIVIGGLIYLYEPTLDTKQWESEEKEIEDFLK